MKNLEIKPKKRFESAKEIKNHKFFENMDWKELFELKVEPPFQPIVKMGENIDVRNFDTVSLIKYFSIIK